MANGWPLANQKDRGQEHNIDDGPERPTIVNKPAANRPTIFFIGCVTPSTLPCRRGQRLILGKRES